jgi:hypothetical protein
MERNAKPFMEKMKKESEVLNIKISKINVLCSTHIGFLSIPHRYETVEVSEVKNGSADFSTVRLKDTNYKTRINQANGLLKKLVRDSVYNYLYFFELKSVDGSMISDRDNLHLNATGSRHVTGLLQQIRQKMSEVCRTSASTMNRVFEL